MSDDELIEVLEDTMRARALGQPDNRWYPIPAEFVPELIDALRRSSGLSGGTE